MPTPIPDSLRLGAPGLAGAEPQDAMAAFARRGLLQESFRWQDVWQEEHSRAFAVAGVMRLDVLGAFRDELELSLKEGRSLADFAQRIRPRLVREGFWGDVKVTDPDSGEIRTTRFNNRRLQLIYNVNLRQSHAAGRWARTERSKATQPFILYRTRGDENVRESHRAWDWLCLPVDHPVWETHYPPNDWGCRCYAFAISESGVQRLIAAGKPIKRVAPQVRWTAYVNPYTGEVRQVPYGVAPGFAYNPGKTHAISGARLLAEAVSKAAPDIGAAAGQVIPQQVTDQLRARWREVVAQTAATMRSHGQSVLVHVIDPQVMRALEAQPLPAKPASAAVWMRDADLLHALRDAKKGRARGLSVDVWSRLPELLDQAVAYFDAEDPALVYAIDLPDGTGKVVVRVNYTSQGWVDGQRVRWTSNFVRTGGLVEPADLSPPRYVRLG